MKPRIKFDNARNAWVVNFGTSHPIWCAATWAEAMRAVKRHYQFYYQTAW